jgi:hypothetical protein
MKCENPNCGKETGGRRYCSARCSNVVRQQNFRDRQKKAPGDTVTTVTPTVGAKSASVGQHLFSGLNPAAAPDTKKAPEKGGEKPENRKNLTHTSAYRGRGSLAPGWLDAQAKAADRPTVTELVEQQIADAKAKADAERAEAAAEVEAFLARGWESIEDPISQAQILRSFAGIPSYKHQKEMKSLVESLGRTFSPRPLSAKGREIEKRLPDFVCPHKTSWRMPCALCDAGIEYVPVSDWTVREWRDRFGRICGQSKEANMVLNALGAGKWAETNRNERPVGSSATGGKLDAIDQASQRYKTIGGKRKKPEGIGPDSYDSKNGDKSAGSQASSKADPNYAGKRFGLPPGAGKPIPEEKTNVTVDDRKLPAGYSGVEKEYLAPEEKEETAALKQFDKDTLVALKKKETPPADPIEADGPLESGAPIDSNATE